MKNARRRMQIVIGACFFFFAVMLHGKQAMAETKYYDCGDSARCRYDESNMTLYIEGKGEVNKTAWSYIRLGNQDVVSIMKKLVIEPGITCLPDYAFQDCTNLETVQLGEGLTELSEACFSGCTKLKGIEFPRSLTVIKAYCFRKCTSIKEVTIPKNVVGFGSGVFNETNIVKAVFEEGTTVIPGSVFYKLPSLKTVIVPNTVKVIGDYAFQKCENLMPFSIPSGLEEIGTAALEGCKKITSIWLPNTFKKGDSGFSGAYIETVQLQYGIEEIPQLAFCKADHLKRIVIPDSVTVIGENAFKGCAALEDVTLSKNLIAINGSVFYGCQSLRQIEIPASLSVVRSRLLSGTNVEKVVFSEGRTSIQKNICYYQDTIKEVVLPNTLTTIAEDSIYSCNSLERIVVPESVEVVDRYAFRYCNNLKEVYIKNPNTVLRVGWERTSGVTTVYGFKGSKTEEYATRDKMKFVEKYHMLDTCWVYLPASLMMTGGWLTPDPVVKLGDTTLTKGVDYTVSYQNNWNVGTATVTIAGTGDNYLGTVRKTFNIEQPKTYTVEEKKSITDCYVSCTSQMTHNGKSLKPKPYVKYGGTVLREGSDYMLTYHSNKNLGKAYVTVQGIGSKWRGHVTKTFKIVPGKNEKYNVGNLKYKITNAATNGKGTVSVVGLAKKAKSITIPKTVKIGGITYQVTAIEKKAFYKQSKLSYINIKTEKLKSIGKQAFDRIYSKATIKLPKKYYKKYEKMIKKSKVNKRLRFKK